METMLGQESTDQHLQKLKLGMRYSAVRQLVLSCLQQKEGSNSDETELFHEVFERIGFSDCSDVRDRISTLLPLSEDLDGLLPDYNMSPTELFGDTISLNELLEFGSYLMEALGLKKSSLDRLKSDKTFCWVKKRTLNGRPSKNIAWSSKLSLHH